MEDEADTTVRRRSWLILLVPLAVLVVVVGVVLVRTKPWAERRPCQLDALESPDGRTFYTRDPDRGCKWVDQDGNLVPGQ